MHSRAWTSSSIARTRSNDGVEPTNTSGATRTLVRRELRSRALISRADAAEDYPKVYR
jgi:hypothetical protein